MNLQALEVIINYLVYATNNASYLLFSSSFSFYFFQRKLNIKLNSITQERCNNYVLLCYILDVGNDDGLSKIGASSSLLKLSVLALEAWS